MTNEAVNVMRCIMTRMYPIVAVKPIFMVYFYASDDRSVDSKIYQAGS